jgi:hypothetical protein
MSAFQVNDWGRRPKEGKFMALEKDSTKMRFHLPKRSLQSAGKSTKSNRIQERMATACKHPKVRIVSRQEDAEFVECLECGEVFDSEEFRDMEIEEIAETEDVSDDS